MQQTAPDVLEMEGKEAFNRRNYLDAEQAFSKAAEFYAARGDEMKSAEMRSNILLENRIRGLTRLARGGKIDLSTE